ncbi:cytochrome C oxidase subunit IV family protein [Parapedobacter sp. 10938]|uniref:cytochrome C oxidase subunit IV family protein n=1 Tax=Parapedobacter flavus TaxID=3110225 RepID=UPI002DB5C128|nr:cytochrome C oxidase subunit IV family protein [Parapedobacter sp. 10938]MEC3878387.1 cytochrome C oxidase subunit IV family protein [Parapedobacter sp. 10938]
MATQDHTVEHAEGQHHEGMTKRKIWQVFFYLLALTALEFFIALVLVHGGVIEKSMAVNVVYIVLTLVKAYYIVAYFMHLKFETFGFIMSVAIVFILIIYFIALMLTEGGYLNTHYHAFPHWANPQ